VTVVADRYHVKLDLDLTAGIRLPAPRREALERIACEAVANAVRHSGSDRVDVRLEYDGSRVRLSVSDQGHGFDTAAPGGGFGLTSMRERARSAGGELVSLDEGSPNEEMIVGVLCVSPFALGFGRDKFCLARVPRTLPGPTSSRTAPLLLRSS